MAEQGTISTEDLALVLLTDSIVEAMQHIDVFMKKHYRPHEAPRWKWWLFERKPAPPAAPAFSDVR